MTTTEPEFYDKAMTKPGALAMVPAEESPWLPLYEEVAGWLNTGPIIDLGCGTGRFPLIACHNGHSGGYLGIDFSPAAVAEAKRYIEHEAPGYQAEFRCEDLREWRPDNVRLPSTTYVCLEVLEHIYEDLEIIAHVPGGHRLLFSVPNYGSLAHVRRFPSPASVWERYGSLLEFRRWSLIAIGNAGKAIHVLDTTRRIESWQ